MSDDPNKPAAPAAGERLDLVITVTIHHPYSEGSPGSDVACGSLRLTSENLKAVLPEMIAHYLGTLAKPRSDITTDLELSVDIDIEAKRQALTEEALAAYKIARDIDVAMIERATATQQ